MSCNQFRVIIDNFILAHAVGQPSQHIIDSNSGVFDAGLATSFAGRDFNYILL
jgi:hypothetical protein